MIVQVTIHGDATVLRQAADLLGKRRAAARAFVIPADNEQYSAAIDSGAIKALHNAGFTICAPGTLEPAVAEGETTLRHPDTPLADLINACAKGDRQ